MEYICLTCLTVFAQKERERGREGGREKWGKDKNKEDFFMIDEKIPTSDPVSPRNPIRINKN